MNVKAIAGYLGTVEKEIVKCEEWANVYFVVVNGFRPVFVSKKMVAKFIEADKQKYNPGQYICFASKAYCKAYGSRPLHNSPQAKANRQRIEEQTKSFASNPAALFAGLLSA